MAARRTCEVRQFAGQSSGVNNGRGPLIPAAGEHRVAVCSDGEMRFHGLFILAVLGAGCATSPSRVRRPGEEGEAYARRLAALDLPCPEAAIRVEAVAGYPMARGYTAHGCGKEVDYSLGGAEDVLTLEGVYPAYRPLKPHPWLQRVWTVLQAQQPATPYTVGSMRFGADFRQQVIHFQPGPAAPPWELRFEVHTLRCKEEEFPAAAPLEEGTQLRVALCGGSFAVIIQYDGPRASLPAPHGLDLSKMAEALRKRLWAEGQRP